MKRSILLVLSLIGILSLAACSDTVTAPGSTDTVSADKRSEMALNQGNRAPAPSGQTIAEIADAAGFTLLLAAVGYIAETNPESGIVAGLLDNNQYTVFAPTDEAFVALVEAVADLLDPDVLDQDGPFAAIDDLLGFGTIEAVVSYHVTAGRRAANSVVPRVGQRTIVTLLEGATFSVNPSAMITAVGNTANITTPNISASNGIIHVIDAVILPIDLGL
jgi:uncharacterized surface protein with fasciclin (FAS1) repeats